MNFYTYIVYNSKYDKCYIGQTSNLERRINEHNSGMSSYTSKYDGEWKMVYHETFNSRSDAMKRENFLKKQKNKEFYTNMCKTGNSDIG